MPPRKKAEENTLLAALQFVSLAQLKRSKTAADVHCKLFGKQLTATTAILSAGVPIQEEIECCPNTQKLIDALKECPEAVSLTILPTKELSVKSGNFQATIPCIEPYELPAIFPDRATATIEPEFERALQQVGSLVNERAKTVLYSSVQLLDGTVIGTNGDVIMEVWHGSPAPLIGSIVPKVFISCLSRTKGKSLYKLGVAVDSLTAHYPDGSWIKTKLHVDPDFPNLHAFLNYKNTPQPTPLGFWAAVDRLAPFSKDGRLYFREDGISTDQYLTDGAINLCSGLPVGISFPIAALQLIAPFAEKFSYNVTNNMSYFFGPKLRGAITQREE